MQWGSPTQWPHELLWRAGHHPEFTYNVDTISAYSCATASIHSQTSSKHAYRLHNIGLSSPPLHDGTQGSRPFFYACIFWREACRLIGLLQVQKAHFLHS